MSGESQSGGLVASNEPCSGCRTDASVVWYRGVSICAACLGSQGVMPTNYGAEYANIHDRHMNCCKAVANQDQADRDRAQRLVESIAAKKALESKQSPKKQIDTARLLKRQGESLAEPIDTKQIDTVRPPTRQRAR